MTRKDFFIVALAIKNCKKYLQPKDFNFVVHKFCETLSRKVSNFNGAKFMKACGYNDN